jgi:predicted transcriptional regulator
MPPNWELISFVKASEIRHNILASLDRGVKTPTELKEQNKVPMSRISTILKELMDNNLVKNLTPDRRKSKIFALTSLGESVLKEIQKNDDTGGS